MSKSRSRNGLSIMELMMAFVIFGVLLSGIASMMRNFEKENTTLHRRIQSATFESNVMLALKSPQLLHELLLDLPENLALRNCLQVGCPIDQAGDVKFNETLDWAYRGFAFAADYVVRGADLIELKIRMTATNSLFHERKFSVYLPRRDFLKLPERLKALRCPKGAYVNGVNFASWSAICERK